MLFSQLFRTLSLSLSVALFVQGCSKQDISNSQPVTPPDKSASNSLDPPEENRFLLDMPSVESVTSVPKSGRIDPFSPVSDYPLPKPEIEFKTPPGLTKDEVVAQLQGLSFTGVAMVSGSKTAFVDYSGFDGDVREGSVGNLSGTRPTLIIPEGWRVSFIDLANGSIRLTKANAKVLFYVGSSKVQIESLKAMQPQATTTTQQNASP